jgi:levanase/fructan beta-fructosidase
MQDPLALLPGNTPEEVGASRYRPRFHFAPKRNWMNDPNGLVYFQGEYHLFFQYNPFGEQWGHMSWGHAVSRDLLTWEELPVAIPETEKEMIFSGCIVVDWSNMSGLGQGDEPPLLAFYTGFDAKADLQRQCLAYSHDRGRTFTFYNRNPLIDLGMAHFRDPKVFYHEPSAAWIMVVALPREHKVQFYRSTNLLDWTLAGAFGPAGATSGQWECPDLMVVPLETDPSQARWVLKIDVDAGLVGGGSGGQYFIGDFDGHGFTIDAAVACPNGEIVDFGPDFYAAATWSDLPPEQPGPLWVGWMSNHKTGRLYPTEPWRGAQSLPRTLYLFEERGRLKLGQRPVASAANLFEISCGRRISAIDVAVDAGPTPDSLHAELVLNVAGPDPQMLEFVAGKETLVTIRHDGNQSLIFTREHHGPVHDEAFAFQSSCPCPSGDSIAIEFFFDSCLVDIFIDGGRRVFSCCVFPENPHALAVRLCPAPTAAP